MRLNKHYDLAGRHAELAPSNYHWINYDEEKMARVWATKQAARRGDALHAFAANAISLGIKLPENKKTINMYVNDAIGYRMTPEQPLYYSDNCFGTADAICFRDNLLRIHDLKTGTTRTSMWQLVIYAALFCLEYGYKPNAIQIELRIYKGDDFEIYIPELDDVVRVMDRIQTFDNLIVTMQKEALL